MSARHVRVRCWRRSEEGVELASAEVVTVVELRIEPGSSAREIRTLKHLALSLVQNVVFNGLQFERGLNIYMPTWSLNSVEMDFRALFRARRGDLVGFPPHPH